MRISETDVRATAALARIALSDEEVVRMRADLDAVLGYMDLLAAIDVEGVAPMTHAVAMDCGLRADRVGEEMGSEAALAAAPRVAGEFLEVPRIVAHDKGS